MRNYTRCTGSCPRRRLPPREEGGQGSQELGLVPCSMVAPAAVPTYGASFGAPGADNEQRRAHYLEPRV